MKAINLKTEYLIEPLGIDIKKPMLSWNDEGDLHQSAYQVTVYANNQLIWDTHKVQAPDMHVIYDGPALKDATRYTWEVVLWNENDCKGSKSSSYFETGIHNWQGQWITGNYHVKKSERYPVDCFKKTFILTSPQDARLYITACGLYEAYLNGQRVGDAYMTPGITDYRKRIAYQTYDVTDLLRKGENELALYLADGWYRGSVGAWGHLNAYGSETKLLAELVCKDAGKQKVIGTDESFLWSNDGPIRFADNKDGEVFNANMQPTYNGHAKKTTHTIQPSASNNVLVKEHQHFHPDLITTPSGQHVLDFHQNIAGIISFTINAHQGDQMKLRFGEMLDEKGEFTQKNIQLSTKKKTTPLQEVVYIAKEGTNSYKTRFAIFGFQYVLIETNIPFIANDFEAIALSSDLEETATFTSSNPLLNQFFQNVYWSARNNACDLPTDCPTRERHGWTGDAQIFCSSASYLFNYMPFAKKFLNDMYDWQKKDGKLPQIAPEGGVDFYMHVMNGSVGWADAGIIIPYVLYKQYQDPRILETFLPGMRKYLNFMKKRCGKRSITSKRTGLSRAENRYISNAGQAYGEWAEPDEIYHMTWKDCAIPHPEVASAYTAHMSELMSEIETVLGHPQEAKEDAEFAQKCKRSYQALRETSQYTLDTDRQAQLVRPLAFHLLNEKQKDYAQKRLIQALKNYHWRIGTGFLSTPLILDVLTQYDIEAAYRLLENEEIPGWLGMVKNGATTIWEAWEGINAPNGIGSLNHYSKGAIIAWLFETMGGIHIEKERHFEIKPVIGGHFTFVDMSYQSIYGQVSSKWQREKYQTSFTITIPTNTTATIQLPDGTTYKQEPGTKTYRMKVGKDE